MSEHSFFKIVPVTITEVAARTGASVKSGDGKTEIVGASPIEDAIPGSLTFIDNLRYAKFLPETRAAAVLCPPKLADKVPDGVIALVHAEPYRAYADALALLYPTAGRPEPLTGEYGISPAAHIAPSASLEENVTVEAGAVIGADAAIGRDSHILANAVIGCGVQIGRGSTIGPAASVSHAFIGDSVILHAGVRIGQDGFGFAMGPGGHRKVAQIGRVIIQDHVEIGANSTVDRGSNRDTVIGEGSKIDNLVQIGHNVVMGRHCIVVGLAGISGSVTMGDFVVVAGQAGLSGHITIHDGAQIGGGSGVHSDIKPGDRVIGYPAMPVKQWVKMNRMLKTMTAGPADKDSGEK